MYKQLALTLGAYALIITGCSSTDLSSTATSTSASPPPPPPITSPRDGWYENKDMVGGPNSGDDKWWEICDGKTLIRVFYEWSSGTYTQSAAVDDEKCTPA